MGISYNRIRRFCAFIIGAVFFVSGLLKLLDPVGAGLVIGEYYNELIIPGLRPTLVAVQPSQIALQLI